MNQKTYTFITQKNVYFLENNQDSKVFADIAQTIFVFSLIKSIYSKSNSREILGLMVLIGPITSTKTGIYNNNQIAKFILRQTTLILGYKILKNRFGKKFIEIYKNRSQINFYKIKNILALYFLKKTSPEQEFGPIRKVVPEQEIFHLRSNFNPNSILINILLGLKYLRTVLLPNSFSEKFFVAILFAYFYSSYLSQILRYVQFFKYFLTRKELIEFLRKYLWNFKTNPELLPIQIELEKEIQNEKFKIWKIRPISQFIKRLNQIYEFLVKLYYKLKTKQRLTKIEIISIFLISGITGSLLIVFSKYFGKILVLIKQEYDSRMIIPKPKIKKNRRKILKTIKKVAKKILKKPVYEPLIRLATPDEKKQAELQKILESVIEDSDIIEL